VIFAIGEHKPEIHPTAFIHPSAEVSGKVRIGKNVSIWGGCVLRGDVDWIEIGDDSNIQDGSVFHTSHNVPVKLEKGVTVGHRAVVHGATVRSYSLIGMGATLLDRSVVEENCLIGAGAIVKEGGVIPKGQLAFGTPAKVIRPLKAEEVKLIVDRAGEYIELAAQYKKALTAAKIS
jgi:carbonic anhydrase/acetyltransferase-like protein (isoleucine patch superfamily)